MRPRDHSDSLTSTHVSLTPKTRRRQFCLAILIAVCTFAPPAFAITVYATDFDLGTDVSHAIPGVTLTTLRNLNPTGYSPVELAVHTESGDGGITFGAGTDALEPFYDCSIGGVGACPFSSTVFQFEFDAPTDYFFVEGYHPADPLSLIAFNSAGELIAGFLGPANCEYGTRATPGVEEEGHQQAWFQCDLMEISRIWYGGGFPDGGVYGPNWFAFNSANVPEPGSLVLLTLGLAGLGFARRRKAS